MNSKAAKYRKVFSKESLKSMSTTFQPVVKSWQILSDFVDWTRLKLLRVCLPLLHRIKFSTLIMRIVITKELRIYFCLFVVEEMMTFYLKA